MGLLQCDSVAELLFMCCFVTMWDKLMMATGGDLQHARPLRRVGGLALCWYVALCLTLLLYSLRSLMKLALLGIVAYVALLALLLSSCWYVALLQL